MDLKFVDPGERVLDFGGATIRYVEALQLDRSAAYASATSTSGGRTVYDPGEFAVALFSRCVKGWENVKINGVEWEGKSVLRVRGRTYRGAEAFVLFDDLAGALLKAILGEAPGEERGGDDAQSP